VNVSGPKWDHIFSLLSPDEAADVLIGHLEGDKPQTHRKRPSNEQSTDGSNGEPNRPKCFPRPS